MKPTDISRLHAPGTPAISPDGTEVTVAVGRADLDADDYTSQLWTVPVDGSRPPRRLTHGWRDSAPRYSPDGAWLAFTRSTRDPDGKVGKPQIHVMPTGGGEPRRLTDHPLGAGAPVWLPDSARLVYTARVPERGRYGTASGTGPEKEPPRRITRLSYRYDDVGFTGDRRSHVFLVDATGEAPRPVQLTDGDHDERDVAVSPDGTLLAFVSARHDTREDDLVADVWTCRTDGTQVRRVTRGGMGFATPLFTPDGTTLVASARELDGPVPPLGRNVGVWAVPVDGCEPPRRLTGPERYNLSNVAAGGAPLEIHPDGVLFPNEHRGAVQLLLVPYGGGQPVTLLDGERQVIGAGYAAGVLAATVATPEHAGEVLILDGTTGPGGGRRVTDFAAALGDMRVLPMTELTAVAADGYPVHGWVVKPDGPGPHPVLLMIHGGPFTQYRWALFDEAQVYAGAGYAVVMGNPRGSSGYGQAHGAAVIGDVGEVSAADLLPLLDRALRDRELDGDRVGVLGGSHGGYMTTWLAAHHGDRFGAAVSERAVNAIDSFHGSSDIGWWFAPALYGTAPEDWQRRSPLSYADRIDIPMLIIHSEQDLRCPLEQAQRLFVALKRRGVEVEMLLFPGEGHEMSRTGLPSHRIARFGAVLDWFDRHL